MIAGSRNFTPQAIAEERILDLIITFCKAGLLSAERDNFVIVTGGAWGTDRIAMKACRHVGVPVAVVKPKYDKYGKGATHIRNDFMLKRSDGLITFWNGTYINSGTSSVIAKALKKGLPAIINRWIPKTESFDELTDEAFVNNAPFDWLVKAVGKKKIAKLFPYYIPPRNSRYHEV